MMLNIYQLHSNPDQLKGYDQAHEKIPYFVWGRFQTQPKQLKKREHVLAKEPYYAYMYAKIILQDRFPEGEEAIAQHPQYAHLYAKVILKDRFLKGEDAIARDKQLWAQYKQRFGIDDETD